MSALLSVTLLFCFWFRCKHGLIVSSVPHKIKKHTSRCGTSSTVYSSFSYQSTYQWRRTCMFSGRISAKCSCVCIVCMYDRGSACRSWSSFTGNGLTSCSLSSHCERTEGTSHTHILTQTHTHYRPDSRRGGERQNDMIV